MAHSFDKLKELNITRDEVNRISEALKKPEFRKLLCEYVEELQDPENKKRYEEEIVQLEKERGVDVTFIHPNAGYVIKTSVNGNQKAFINICTNDNVQKPASTPTVKEGTRGLNWSLPHTLTPPREDIDNKGACCQVFDVVFHPDTLHLGSKNAAFHNMVNSTALDAVENNFDVKLDKKNLKFPKLSYKGMPHPSVIRSPSEKPPNHTAEEKEFYDNLFSKANLPPVQSPSKKQKKTIRKNSTDDKSEYTTPKYIIKHRTHVDLQEFTEHKDAKLNTAIPKELVLVIDLPLLKSSGDIMVEVTEKTVQLVSEKPAKYKLNLTLPYKVNDSIGNAKFNKDLKQLVITLPVKNCTSSAELSDSGVESDHGGPCSPEFEELNDTICDTHIVEPSNKCIEKHPGLRTMFLDKDVHYSLPEFSCHVFENVIAFTLNVKNVDENSVGKMFPSDKTVHVKFTSIGSSFYPSHYSFFIQLSENINQDDTVVEVWDNNVVLQVPVNCSNVLFASYFYGTSEDDLKEKLLEEPEVLKAGQQEEPSESSKELNEGNQGGNFDKESINCIKSCSIQKSAELSASNPSINNAGIVDHDYHARAIDIAGTSCESSGDELSCSSSYSPRKNKGILKRLSTRRFPPVGRSISESSLDDFVCSSSFENCHSLESGIPEDGEVSTSLKKTVRFNDVVMRQLFRSNSSILGQKKRTSARRRRRRGL
nr:unnamed protein product [Callosobruchus analis]